MRRRRQEGGFALLLIFAIAAAAAIMLYLELPRAVFESARAKEDMLVERGEQFKVALRRFYTKTRRLPMSLDELENTNGVRFLRRKYVDPMTGKAEWRLIHLGPAGELADSKVTKPANATQGQKSVNTLVTEGYQVGGGLPDGSSGRNIQDIAIRQRPSDRAPIPGAAEAIPGEPEPPPPPGQELGAPGDPAVLQSQAVLQNNSGNTLQTGTNQPLGPAVGPLAGGMAGQGMPGLAPPGAYAANSQTGGAAASINPSGAPSPFGAQGVPQAQGVFPGQPGYPGTQGGAGGSGGTGGQNPALDMIRNLLTTPRQGGAPGTATSATNQNAMSGQIAGVASKYEGQGIKLINERSKIDEWEFVFDFRNARTAGPQAGGGVGGQGQGSQGLNWSGPGTFGGGGRNGQGGGGRNGQGGGAQNGQGRPGGGFGPGQAPGSGFPGGNPQSPQPGFPNRPR